ncbi:hypothetical protein DFH28DRAFT_903747 [Melampsora americana]|nr:hypothetical protein DFH28DRAFT_903747 [Melampsora americana]
MNEIEVKFIDEEEEEEEDWLTRFSRINWIQRELEIQRLVIKSKEVEKLKKKGSKKALPSDSVQLQIPSLINEVDHFNLHSNRLLKNAVVRFKSSDQLHQLLSIDPSNLPLKWPSSSSSVTEHDQSSWLSKYRTQRKSLRPSYESVKAHTDAWMIASDSGQIKPLSLISKGKSGKKGSEEAAEAEAEDEMKVDEDDGEGEWITVTRGGQHGRSSTIPTQPKEIKGADPYAQSSMSGRDSLAGVKVMKRGFLEAFKQDELQDHQSKRKGGELNTGFYKTNVNENKRLKMFELRKKFDEDKARVERMKNSRKFKPY